MFEIAGGILLAIAALVALVLAIANWRMVGSLACAAALGIVIYMQLYDGGIFAPYLAQ